MAKLFIAEKPKLANAIAAGIGVKGRKSGYIECNNGDIVTWGFGHMLELAEASHYDPKFKRWSFNDLPIIPDEMIKVVRDDAGVKKQLRIIKTLLKSCSTVVNAGDPDREGQLLIDEILEEFQNKKPVERIWLSSLDLKNTKKALSSMKDNSDYQPLKRAAEARSQSDWLVGINLTRAASLTLQSQGGFTPISIGRVQTPTLALVVNKELNIRNFKSRDYFICSAQLEGQGVKFKSEFKPKYNDNLGGDSEGYLIEESVAKKALCDIELSAKVTEFNAKPSKTNQPLCYSLSALQKDVSSKIGLGAKQTLDVVQKLYESAFVSYPRTDCGFLPEEQHSDAENILKNVASILPIAKKADISIQSPTWNSKKVSAHHGIIPTETTVKGLSDQEMGVYLLIVKRYVSQFFGPEIFSAISVKIKDASGNTWISNGRNVKDHGWKSVYQENKGKEFFPTLENGEKLSFVSGAVDASKTKPPSRFTQGTLIDAMTSVHNYIEDPKIKKMLKETSGIGTEATRANIIETLLKRQYMKEEKKKLVPSELGIFLIESLAPRLVDPGVTAVWEEYLKLIETGEMTFEQFLSEQKKFIPKWIEDIKEMQFPASIISQFPKKTPVKNKKRTRK